MDVDGFELGLLVGVLVGEGSFGGDGRQPSVTVRMHTRHEALLRKLCDVVPGARLYGPYDHSGRRYFQWIVRGPALRRLVGVLDDHLTPSLDGHAAERYQRMRRTYARALTGRQSSQETAPAIVAIRPARRGDASRLADLVSQLGYPVGTDRMLERLDAVGQQPFAATLVAEIQDAVAGFVGVRREPLYEADAPAARITALVVDTEHRRRGVGEALVARAEAWAADHGCGSVVLTSANHRAGAHAFYRRMGYGASGVRFAKDLTEDGQSRVSRPSERRRPPRRRSQ